MGRFVRYGIFPILMWRDPRQRVKRRGFAGAASVCVAAIAVGIAAKMISAHEDAEFLPPLFTLTVGEQGSTTGFWAPGTKVTTTEDGLVPVEIRVPEKFANAIEKTFEQDYEDVEPPKLLRVVVVIGGIKASTSDCHWHGGIYHCHAN